MFLSASAILIISISTALSCFSRLSNAAAAAVPLTSEGSIIPAQLQQQSNNKNATQSPNTTDMINGLPSINTIPIANSTTPPNDIYRYPVPGTKYMLYILDCTTPLPPFPLKSALTTGISAIESKIDSGAGFDAPYTFTAFASPVSIEWYLASFAAFQCPYSDLLHLWKALRLVLLDRGSRRFPAWLFAKECDCRVNWIGVPGEPESVGGFVIKIVEGREGGLVGGGGGLGGAAMRGVGTA